LDHGGTTIYAKSLIDSFAADLASNLYGNPHSASTPARLSGQVVDDTREKTLRFFGADPEHFDLIFVANATAAIKLVMESFKDLGNANKSLDGDEGGFWYGYHIDCHNSVIGVRESCEGNHRCFRTDAEVEQWLFGSLVQNKIGRLGLFAYPGQSNMTGRRLPLTWPGVLRSSANPSHRDIYSLLDAAALATTYPLNGIFQDPDSAPDFTALSFYKIFGFPDLGGLIVRKASGKILQWRKYFGGGTVSMVTVLGNKPWFRSRDALHSSLEDGTLPFHSIIALNLAIATHERLYGPNPMAKISLHANFLGKRLYDGVSSLYHYTGIPVCQIYKGNNSTYGDSMTQGATISFNVVRPDGTYLPYTSIVERLANDKHIYVRAGQLCNPGGIATHLGFDTWHMKALYEYGHRCGGAAEAGTEVVKGKPTGVVRVSLGAMTTIANVDTLITFLRDEFQLRAPTNPSLPTKIQTNNLAIRNREDIPRSTRADKRFTEQAYPQDSPVSVLPFAPNMSSNSTTDLWQGIPFTNRREGYSPSINDFDDRNVQMLPPHRRPGPLMPPVRSEFHTLSASQSMQTSTLNTVNSPSDDTGSMNVGDDRRGLKRLWKNKSKKDGMVGIAA